MFLRRLARTRPRFTSEDSDEETHELEFSEEFGANDSSSVGIHNSLPRELQNLLNKVLSDQQIVDKIVSQESFRRIVEGNVAAEEWAQTQYNLLKDRARRVLELPDEPEVIPLGIALPYRRGSLHRFSTTETPISFRGQLFVDDPRLSFLLNSEELDMRSHEPIRATFFGGWRPQGLSALLSTEGSWRPPRFAGYGMSSSYPPTNEQSRYNDEDEEDEFEQSPRGGHAGSPPRFWSGGQRLARAAATRVEADVAPVVSAIVVSVAVFVLLSNSLIQSGRHELADRVAFWARKVGDWFMKVIRTMKLN